MANLNKVMLIGNLTRDPELRYTPKGTAVADIGMAINRVWTNDQGERQEETTFVDVTLWGRQAELAQQYLSKGRPVYIEGRLQMDTWEDKSAASSRSLARTCSSSAVAVAVVVPVAARSNQRLPKRRVVRPQPKKSRTTRKKKLSPFRRSPRLQSSPHLGPHALLTPRSWKP